MKKWKITIAIVVVAILGLFFFLPRPVIREPEKAVLNSIYIQKDPYYQKESSDSFGWTPTTEEEKEIAQEILQYLSHQKERRTLRKRPDVRDYPLSWKCMYISISYPQTEQTTVPRGRSLILGPSKIEEDINLSREIRAVNLSYPESPNGVWERFVGRLEDPDGIRSYILEKLNLPEDFM